jgi:hypothetical protein
MKLFIIFIFKIEIIWLYFLKSYNKVKYKMLTFNDATKILGLSNIPPDVQTKILLLFIGFGTPTSRIIKKQLECSDTSFNGSLVERIILENDLNTLWRLKVFLNKFMIFQRLTFKKRLTFQNLSFVCELQVAYLSDGIYNWDRFACISNLLDRIKTNSDSELFAMFYNLDKNKYKYLGTPTANIINNAIINKIIKEVDPMIW